MLILLLFLCPHFNFSSVFFALSFFFRRKMQSNSHEESVLKFAKP